MPFPLKFLQKPSPYFLRGAFAPLFMWCRCPCIQPTAITYICVL